MSHSEFRAFVIVSAIVTLLNVIAIALTLFHSGGVK